MNIVVDRVDREKYIVAEYYLSSSVSLFDAAWNIAIGQSVGNPNIRNEWETDELYENHSCKIIKTEGLKDEYSGLVRIAYPIANIDLERDGISQLMCFVMGGHLDIDSILTCHLLDLQFPPEAISSFNPPKYGIDGIREFTGVYDKPLLGGIIKPKTGIDTKTLLKMVKQLVEGGVNFIKEDEIMSNPHCCRLKERAEVICEYLQDKNVIYSFCINSDYPECIKRAEYVHKMGGNSVHINIWNGLGVYNSLRKTKLPLFLHFQKSGDKILTDSSHRFHVDWNVVCKLAGIMGVDFIHAGMWGGYSSDNEDDLRKILSTLRSYNVMPALSCGMHPGVVNIITEKFGIDYMANVGGAIHGHPNGTLAGVKAMRQAIDGNYEDEYYQAISKWGLVDDVNIP